MPPLAPVMLVQEHAPVAAPRQPGSAPTDWPGLVAACPSKSLQALLSGLILEKLEHARITLRVPANFAKMVDLRREEIALALGRAAGRPLALECIVEEAPASPTPSMQPGGQSSPGREQGEHGRPAQPGNAGSAVLPGRAAPQPLPTSSMSDHPLVRQAAELLNARLIRVERRESSNG
jgi:hypothetical protein